MIIPEMKLPIISFKAKPIPKDRAPIIIVKFNPLIARAIVIPIPRIVMVAMRSTRINTLSCTSSPFFLRIASFAALAVILARI